MAVNVLHMKYAVEIAKTGSISKASEKLLVAQPNLSRSVKELETGLGIVIFERSPHGVTLTPEGEQFIGYAEKILKQIAEVEAMYKNGVPVKHHFSISVPRACYIAEAFAQFSKTIGSQPVPQDPQRAINNILYADYKLGILRYAENYDRYFKEMLEEKGLAYELVAEFRYVLLMRKDSPLAQKTEIRFSDLQPLIEIAHADPYVPSLSLAEVKKEELPNNTERRIFVFERASQLELLSQNEETFMWVSPVPESLVRRYGLVQRECVDNQKFYKDVLIYKRDYCFTELDNQFITELCNSRRTYL